MAAALILILGPTGAGKSYQAAKLAAARGWENISSGELLRATSDIHIKSELATGELVETPEVEQLVREALDRADPNTPVILDGFPREMREAKWLDELMPELSRELTQVLYLDVARDITLERLRKRHRSDDNQASLEHKWEWYAKETQPVIDHYQESGKLVRIDGAGSPDEVFARIEKVIQG
jgi:adenylate kinase